MEVLVKHYRYGEVVVEAMGRTEAIVRAAIIWGRPFTEIVAGSKIGLHREDLERLREQSRQIGGTAGARICGNVSGRFEGRTSSARGTAGTEERIPTALRASE